MRIVLDTNGLISIAAFRGQRLSAMLVYPGKKHHPVLSSYHYHDIAHCVRLSLYTKTLVQGVMIGAVKG